MKTDKETSPKKSAREIIEADLVKQDQPEQTQPEPTSPLPSEGQAEKPPEATEPKKDETTAAPAAVNLPMKMDTETGMVIVETLSDEMKICAGMVQANMVPASLNTPQKLFVARQLCRELGLPATSAIRQVYVVNGVPTLWGDTPLALVRSKGLLEKIDEYFITKDYVRICVKNKNLHEEIYAAVCEIQRKGDELKEYHFTRDQATAAGLMKKDLYSKYFGRMIRMKARGEALKNEFSDVLNGVAMAEYDFDQLNGVRDVTDQTKGETANKANSLFGTTTGESQKENH